MKTRTVLVVFLALLLVASPLPLAKAQESVPGTIAQIQALPIVFEETSSYIRLNFSMFTVDFYKTAGYNVIYGADGEIDVHNERQVLEYWTGNQWKQRGTPVELSWVKIDDWEYNVTRHYKDWAGTFYNVTFVVRSDTQIKSVISIDSGQTDEYRLGWELSGIVHTDWDESDNRLTFGENNEITFDWTDVYETLGDITETSIETHAQGRKASIFFNIGVVEAGQKVIIDPAIVATSTSFNSGAYAYMRKGFYAAGLFWSFYIDATPNAGWEFTANPNAWDGAFTSIGGCGEGYDFSIWFDGTYVHYTRSAAYDLYYRRGTPENNGTITWSAAEQLVDDGSFNDYYSLPALTVDSSGYAWIGSKYEGGANDYPYVLKNANNDGTWSTDFEYQLHVTADSSWRVSPVPLTSGKVYVLYIRSGQILQGNLYNAGWVGEEATLMDYAIEQSYEFSAVAYNDNIHLVYNRDITNQIRYAERVWGVGWDVNDVLVQDSVNFGTSPTLTVDPSENELFCFWLDSTTDHVYYKNYDAGWDVGATDWIDESTDGIKDDWLMSSYYADYGGYVGVFYSTKLSSLYNVKFAYPGMPINVAPTAPTLDSPTSNSYHNPSASISFEWTFNDPDGGDSQSAYQLQIDGELDTGKEVDGTESTSRTIPASVGSYQWRVRTWDQSDEVSPYSGYRTFIVDRIHATGISATGGRIDVGSSGQVDITLKYDYDETVVTDGTVTIEGDAATHQGLGVWRSAPNKGSAQLVTFGDTVALSGNTHGITAYDQNGQSANSIWDQIEIVSVAFLDGRQDPSQADEVRYGLRYDYDDVAFEGADGSIIGFTWDAGNSWWDKAVTTPAAVGFDNYDENDLGLLTDTNYGLTVYEDDAGANLISDRIDIATVTFSDNRVNIGATSEVRYTLEWNYDATPFEGADGTIVNYTWDAGNSWWDKAVTSPEAVGAELYDENDLGDITDTTYGITGIEDDAGASLIGDEIIWVTCTPDDPNPPVGTKVLITGTWKLSYDNHAITTGDTIALTDGVTNNTMIWDGAIFELTDIATGGVTVVYDEFTGTEVTYGITAINNNGISISVQWGINPINRILVADPFFNRNNESWVNVTISDAEGVANLKWVDITIYTLGDTENFTFRWTQGGTFSELSDPFGIATIDIVVSERTNINGTHDRISFYFAITGGTDGDVDVVVTTTDDYDLYDVDRYVSAFEYVTYGWTAIGWLINSAFDYMGIANFMTQLTAYIDGFTAYFSTSLTNIVDMVFQQFRIVGAVFGFFIFWYTAMIGIILDFSVFYQEILDSTSVWDTGLGNIWEIVGYTLWSPILPLAFFIWWIDSIDKRARVTTGGEIQVVLNDINSAISLLSYFMGAFSMVVNTVIDRIYGLIDAIP